jgi:hypothetical protein
MAIDDRSIRNAEMAPCRRLHAFGIGKLIYFTA